MISSQWIKYFGDTNDCFAWLLCWLQRLWHWMDSSECKGSSYRKKITTPGLYTLQLVTDYQVISVLSLKESLISGSVQFSRSVVPTLCDPMNRSTPGLPVHHQLLEFTQTHIHGVSDAIQPSHPLSSPSPPAPNPSQHQSLFQLSQPFAWGGQSTGVSALASFLPKKSQGWSPSEWTGWISLQSMP